MNDCIASLLGEWSTELNTGSVLLRIGLSVLLSAIIGFERSSKRHSAGLRTFIIVSLAATTAAMIELYLKTSFVNAAVIIGIAMLSGYSIFFSSRGQIKGLTTSAGLWSCGIIGIAIGLGMYTVSFTISSKELKKYKSHSQIIEALRSLDYISFIDEIN